MNPAQTNYSTVYTTAQGEYRFNYETGLLERIGRKVVRVEHENRMIPVVENAVLETYGVSRKLFEENPQYWVQFCEDIQKHQHTQDSERNRIL